MYNTTNSSPFRLYKYSCWQKKASNLLFHPISGFLPKTKFKKFTSHAIGTFTRGSFFLVFSSPNFDIVRTRVNPSRVTNPNPNPNPNPNHP